MSQEWSAPSNASHDAGMAKILQEEQDKSQLDKEARDRALQLGLDHEYWRKRNHFRKCTESNFTFNTNCDECDGDEGNNDDDDDNDEADEQNGDAITMTMALTMTAPLLMASNHSLYFQLAQAQVTGWFLPLLEVGYLLYPTIVVTGCNWNHRELPMYPTISYYSQHRDCSKNRLPNSSAVRGSLPHRCRTVRRH